MVLALLLAPACTRAAGDEKRPSPSSTTDSVTTPAAAPLATTGADPVSETPVSETTEPTTTTAVPVTTVRVTTTKVTTTTTTTAPPSGARTVTEQRWTPFAAVGGVTLVHPSSRVERVGFHESNHDGARQLEPLPTAASPMTLETRNRGTGSRTSADIVVDPGVEIRSPVTGRVKRAGTYVLYCDYSDDYVVIAPDGQPEWEVKILHISGVRVRAGQRVTAGRTVLAPRATQLPFESQVDKARTDDPAWPHVHLEVVDPAIRDRPSPGGGCK